MTRILRQHLSKFYRQYDKFNKNTKFGLAIQPQSPLARQGHHGEPAQACASLGEILQYSDEAHLRTFV